MRNSWASFFLGILCLVGTAVAAAGATQDLKNSRAADPQKIYSVMSFGAKCDGVTDDAAAIQSTIDAASKLGGTVAFPGRKCGLKSGLTIRTNSPVHLSGEGYESQLFYENPGGIATGIFVQSSSNIEISSLRVMGSTRVPTLSRGIYISTSSNVRVHNVWESGATFRTPDANLIVGIGTTQSSDIWITECDVSGNGFVAAGTDVYNSAYDILNYAPTAARIHFRNNKVHDSSAAFSIIMFDVTDSDILDNQVDQNNKLGTAHTSSGYGIAVYGAVAVCSDIKVSHNTVTNTAGFGIYLASVRRAVCDGNKLDTVIQQQRTGPLALAGMTFNDVVDGTMTDNTIVGSGQQGIWISNSSSCSVSGNAVKNSAIDGIKLNDSSNITINGNRIDDAGGNGIGGYGKASLSKLTITSNAIRSPAAQGILLNGGVKDSAIGSNTIYSPGADGILILDAVNSARLSVTRNTITGITSTRHGISIYGSKHVITGNVLLAAGQAATSNGISLDGPTSDSIVSDNRISGFEVGVDGTKGQRNELTNNILAGNSAPLATAETTKLSGNRTAGVIEGRAVLVGGTARVNTAAVRKGDTILVSNVLPGGTVGTLSVGAIVTGRSFVINSTNALDASTVFWQILH